jgi:hypothetical protein
MRHLAKLFLAMLILRKHLLHGLPHELVFFGELEIHRYCSLHCRVSSSVVELSC